MDENEYKKRSVIWLYPQTFKNVDGKIDSNAIREMRKRKQALGQKLDLKEMKL